MSDDALLAHIESSDSIDSATFQQILEMDDDDEDREFSRSIVYGFFEQADTTFTEMDKALDDKDLLKLSELGHFLKGSSATLGLTIVKNGCEKIQNYGKLLDETGNKALPEDQCLKEIEVELRKIRENYVKVEKSLKKFYDD